MLFLLIVFALLIPISSFAETQWISIKGTETLQWDHDGGGTTGYLVYLKDKDTGEMFVIQDTTELSVGIIKADYTLGMGFYLYGVSAYLSTDTQTFESDISWSDEDAVVAEGPFGGVFIYPPSGLRLSP